MNAPIIGQRGCNNCAHHGVQNRQMVCMLNPPQASAVLAYVETLTPVIGRPELPPVRSFEPQPRGFIAAFPSVAPELKCGQHKYVAIYDVTPHHLPAT